MNTENPQGERQVTTAINDRAISWENAARRMSDAFTDDEIRAAERVMLAHLTRFPDDIERDPWHGWSSVRAACQERKQQGADLGLTPVEFSERETLLKYSSFSVDYVADPDSIRRWGEHADKMAGWLVRFPHDRTLRDALTYLRAELHLANQATELLAGNALISR